MKAKGADAVESNFKTQKGYDLENDSSVTAVMEDYIEMIYRESQKCTYTRVSKIAADLNVKPSAASKMAAKLKELGLINYEKYGIITLTEEGERQGAYLLKRHEVIYSFFCFLTGGDVELKQIEQIEHFTDEKIIKSMERFLRIYASSPETDAQKKPMNNNGGGSI